MSLWNWSGKVVSIVPKVSRWSEPMFVSTATVGWATRASSSISPRRQAAISNTP